MRESLAIIGAGRVGRSLGRLLHEIDWKIGAVVTRNAASARRAVRFMGAGEAHAFLSRRILASRVILIAVPDDAVEDIAEQLGRIGGEELRGKIVLHTSGALEASALRALRPHGAAVGSMHPLQSFSGIGAPALNGKMFAIDGDPPAVRVARQIARALGGTPLRMAGNRKMLYHVAAAFAASHILAVQEAATQLMMSAGMNRRTAMRALLPLTKQVFQNFERLGPLAAWTGPLARGDYGVVSAHLVAVREMPAEFGDAYQSLNRLAARVLAHDSDSRLAQLEKFSVMEKAMAKRAGG